MPYLIAKAFLSGIIVTTAALISGFWTSPVASRGYFPSAVFGRPVSTFPYWAASDLSRGVDACLRPGRPSPLDQTRLPTLNLALSQRRFSPISLGRSARGLFFH